ncbi:hypothetical protein EOL96_06535 [Candidatus Saccharibacteria bacterium]|nr:hypothetical protein [Candidatus Saccharibacteria bacterium]
MKTLFIHRSVGQNLIAEGRLRELLHAYDIALDDYDNNTGTLTAYDNSTITNSITIPGNNTNPDNLAQYFKKWDELLENYDSIMVKSCYPNSHIKNESQFKKMQQSYVAVFEAFMSHRKQVVLLTSPPLRPLFTNREEARLVAKLNEWLLGSVNQYVRVLDFHALLAEPRGRHMGMLHRDYRRLLPYDNHPNKKANREIAPLVANFLAAN